MGVDTASRGDKNPQVASVSPLRNILVNDPTEDSFPNITQVEPSIAVFGSNVAVGWNDSGHSVGRIRGVGFGIGYGFSTDGGSTFTDAGGLGGSNWGADPTLAVDRAGNFYFARLDLGRGIAVYKSTDGGITFGQPVSASPGLRVQDKSFIAVDNTGGPFDGNVYVSWTNPSSNILTIMFSRSTDSGASFSTPMPLSPAGRYQGSMPAIGPNGEIYVVWLDLGSNQILLRESIDGGLTFGSQVLVATANPIGSFGRCPGRSLKGDIRPAPFPIISVDKSGGPFEGNVYVAFSSDPDGSGPDMADVFLSYSTDGGKTWSLPIRLNDDRTTNDQWLPFVAVAPNGAVGVMWYDRRLDPENLLIDVFMTISTDGGASFGMNFRITEVSFPVPPLNPNFDPLSSNCNIGDYIFMVADANSFYLAWTDNRIITSGVPDPNIFFAKVPVEFLSLQ